MELICPICVSADVVEWYPAGVHRLEDVSFSYSFDPKHTKTFRVIRCRFCSHAFCSPIPKGITNAYENVVDEEYLKHSLSRRLSANAVLKSIQQYVPSGSLLDVGCATGDFLLSARECGYDVEGLELSQWSLRIARERGLNVYCELLEKFVMSCQKKFDIVTLMGVIEHFTDPLAAMRHISEIVKPGWIIAVWTGDVDSLPSRILGRKWWYWQGQHIQYFTKASLKYLVRKSGFYPLVVKRYPFVATHETISNSLRRYRFQKAMSAACKFLFLLKPLLQLRLPGEMLFFARRVHE